MNKITFLFPLVLLFLLFSSCRKEQVRLLNRLEGEWSMTVQKFRIYNNGGVELLEEFENIGLLTVSEDQFSNVIKGAEIDMGEGGDFCRMSEGLLTLDEAVCRFSFVGDILCSGTLRDLADPLFDGVWTVYSKGLNKHVWEAYEGNLYDPTVLDFHDVWRLTLKK